MRYFLESKIIRLLIAALILMLVACCIVTNFVIADKVNNPVVTSHKISKFAKMMTRPGYTDMRLIDTKSHIILGVKAEGNVKFLDFKENTIKELEGFNGIGTQKGDLIEIKNKKGSTVINYKGVLEGQAYDKKVYDNVQLSSNGKYYIGYSTLLNAPDGHDYEVLKADGTKIFSNKHNVSFLGAGDFVSIDKDGDGLNESIVRLSNLKTLKKFDAGFSVSNKAGDNWIIRCETNSKDLSKSETYYVLADKNFSVKYDLGIFGTLKLSSDGNYLVGKKLIGYNSVPSTEELEKSAKIVYVVMDLSGKTLYESNEQRNNSWYSGEVEFLDVVNGILRFEEYGNDNKYRYLNLKELGKGTRVFSYKIDRGKAFSILDIKDGIQVVNKEVDKSVGIVDFSTTMNLSFYENSDNNWMEDFEWGFVDENNELICDYMFQGAYPTQDGYAVVKSGEYWHLLKFK